MARFARRWTQLSLSRVLLVLSVLSSVAAGYSLSTRRRPAGAGSPAAQGPDSGR